MAHELIKKSSLLNIARIEHEIPIENCPFHKCRRWVVAKLWMHIIIIQEHFVK